MERLKLHGVYKHFKGNLYITRNNITSYAIIVL